MASPLPALRARMTQAICRGDAEAAAACFTEEGAYHDGFYGEFRGRAGFADERILKSVRKWAGG